MMNNGKSSDDGMGNFGLHGRRAIVTGASRGIGRALAIGLAKAGADVALIGRDPQALAETSQLISVANPNSFVETSVCDIRQLDQIEATVTQLAYRPIDILVNNAGLNIRTPALDVTNAEWQTIMDTDLRGAFFMAQRVGAKMVENQRGSIVNISSVGGQVALRTGVVYAAAKAGVIQMTKVLSLEWARHRVRVNCIAPWYFRTPLTEKLLSDAEYLAEILRRTPMGRVGDVSELVGPTVFLASDASSYITGQTLSVDGGMSVYGF